MSGRKRLRRRSSLAVAQPNFSINTPLPAGLVNTSWTAYRVSPLHNFSTEESDLNKYARQLAAAVQVVKCLSAMYADVFSRQSDLVVPLVLEWQVLRQQRHESNGLM